MHRQVKTSDIISRRFRDFMTPLSWLQMRIKLTNARSRVTTQSDLHSGGGTTNTLARIESACTFKLGVNCLVNEMLYIKQLTPSLNVIVIIIIIIIITM